MTQYVYGKNVVKQLPQDGKPIHEVLIQEGIHDTALEGEIKKGRIPTKVLGRKKMDQLLNGNHQGTAACTDDYKTRELEELLESIPQGKQSLLVMLDGLEDFHNPGVILRTCGHIRADDVAIGKHRNVRLTPTVVKVSTGAIDTIKVSVVISLVQATKYLKRRGYWVVGTGFENFHDYREEQYDIPLVFVIGSESPGISSLVKKNCDYCARLPMEGSVSSLNVSVATGILLYQIHAQRRPLQFSAFLSGRENRWKKFTKTIMNYYI